MQIQTVEVGTPAAPGNNATVVLFNSTRMNGGTTDGKTPGWIRNNNVTWYEVAFLSVDHDSAANGLKVYSSSDGGANWDQIETGMTRLATVAGTVDTYRWYVGQYTAGAAGPTVWRVTQKLTIGDHARVS